MHMRRKSMKIETIPMGRISMEIDQYTWGEDQ
jgi:hypothetical protein